MAIKLRDYWIITDAVDYSDGAAAYAVGEIPAETLVIESAVLVKTLFTGTSPTLDLGDGDDDDYFVDSTDVTATTAGAYMSAAGASGNCTFKYGHYYASKNTIVLTLGGTGLSTGVAYGVLHCLDLSVL